MIDILNPDQDYSVAEYKKETENIIKKLHSKWMIPIICWWTWLYLDSIAYNFLIPEIEPDWEFRNEIEKIRLEKWNEFIWNMLYEKDKDYAEELEPNNYRYVIRWLEVLRKTWKSKKELKTRLPEKYNIHFITPYDWDREKLYHNINKRVKQMFEEWLIEEVKSVIWKWYKKDCFWLNTIWYKEVISLLDWTMDKESCIEIVQKNNRNYAKRQLTWFKKYSNSDLTNKNFN